MDAHEAHLSGISFFLQRLRECIWREGERNMELLLYRLLCLAATVFSFFVVIPTNYLHRLPPGINLAVALFGLGTLFLSRESCRGRYHIKSLFFLLLALLNLIWFANGGSQGSVSYFFFCLFLLTVAAFICSMMLWALLRRYDSEQKRLISLNEELQRNLAERAQVEDALLQNRWLLNAVVEGTTDAIFVKDVEGKYLLFNSAAAFVAGKSAAQVLGKDDTDLFPPDVARRLMDTDRSILADNVRRTVEETLTTRGGTRMIRESTKGPLHDGQGRITGLFGISRDVTKSRRTAEELGKLNEELEKRVCERTARLEAAMREQETFSYSVSHDLRGPLRHINCYTAILEEEFGPLLPPEARQYLDRIRNSSRRMGGLIDDLLELSRVGRLEPRKVPVSLEELARSVFGKLQDAEPARRVELVVEPGLRVHGDEVLLEQMLDNLIGNAWKYSAPRESARIELGRYRSEDREVFFVRDNGVGFDMAYRDKLFGAFQRLHGAEFEGTGIGLATVKRIVERHQGSVWAEGVVDQGATIYFMLAD